MKHENITIKTIIWICGIVFSCGIAYASVIKLPDDVKENSKQIQETKTDIAVLSSNMVFIRASLERIENKLDTKQDKK